MDQHPPTEQGALTNRRWPGRATLIIVCCGACCIVLLAIALWLQTLPDTLYARSPSIGPVPTGIHIDFDRGRWTNAVLVVNDSFTCSLGDLAPGAHVIAWNRLQGPSTAPLNMAMVRTITLRGDVDGKPHSIDCTTTTGPGFAATSYVVEENRETPKEAP